MNLNETDIQTCCGLWDILVPPCCSSRHLWHFRVESLVFFFFLLNRRETWIKKHSWVVLGFSSSTKYTCNDVTHAELSKPYLSIYSFLSITWHCNSIFFFTYHYSRMSLPGIRNESTSALILKGHYTSTEDAAEYWHKGESSNSSSGKKCCGEQLSIRKHWIIADTLNRDAFKKDKEKRCFGFVLWFF